MTPRLEQVKDGVARLLSLLRIADREYFAGRRNRMVRRILGIVRRICIVLEMRHLLATPVEKATPLLLE
jgi:hypothetical protein